MAEFVAWPVWKSLFLHRWKRLKTSPNLYGIIPWPAELRVCQHLLQDLEAFTTWGIDILMSNRMGGLWFYDDSDNPVEASICIILRCHLLSWDEVRTIGGWFSKLHEGNLRTFSRVTKHSIVLAVKAGTGRLLLVIDVLTLIDLLKERERKREREKKQIGTFGVKHSLPTSTAYSVADTWHSDPSPPCSQR